METADVNRLRSIPHAEKHKLESAQKVYTHADMDEPYVAITFDDGPNPYITPKILDLLNKHNTRATFFVVGKFCEKHPDIVKRIVREGHSIGNHSWSHTRGVCDFHLLTHWFGAHGIYTPFFRAPWFQWDVMREHSLGHPKPILVGADRDTTDWRGVTSESTMIAKIMPLYDGSILLFHDGYGNPADERTVEEALKTRALNTLDSLQRVIVDIRGNGFQPVPLSMMTFDGRSLRDA